jgi:FtsP/CotA-like multicopper oxidase with cupredoxin domain
MGEDPGRLMGRAFADAPGPRVSPIDAATQGAAVPVGATVDRAARSVAFHGPSVHFSALTSPARGPDETFRVAGMVDPTIIVPLGATVAIQVINADDDTAHGLVVTPDTGGASAMPMMTAAPAFPGAALWFLGDPTPAGMHAGTLRFTASRAGTYRYLCPVPGHVAKGMEGVFEIAG